MFRRPPFTVPLAAGRSLDLTGRTLVMGILNITPDSFADGGLWTDPGRAADAALGMEADGADIIDIGGESTRPGADPLPADVELARVMPVIEAVAPKLRVPISIDTYKADVARRALGAGAAMVNDVSGLRYDPSLAAVVAHSGAAIVLMHNRGRSREMYQEAVYESVVDDITRELGERIAFAAAAGIAGDRVILDPGIGFAKRAAHSLELLGALDRLAVLGRPILSGPSRKSFLTAAVGERRPRERDWGTAAAVAVSVMAGAHIVRVHAVKEMVDVVRTIEAIRRTQPTQPTQST